MNVGDPIFEVTDNEMILGLVISTNNDGSYNARATAVIPKDAFVAAYDKWIRGDKKSVTRRIVEFIKSHF